MDAIQIQGINAADFMKCLDERIACLMGGNNNDFNDVFKMVVEQSIIDRSFITRNLKLSYRKITQYEKEGVLKRIAAAGDAKSCYYRFADYLKLVEIEHAKLHKKTI